MLHQLQNTEKSDKLTMRHGSMQLRYTNENLRIASAYSVHKIKVVISKHFKKLRKLCDTLNTVMHEFKYYF